MTATIQYFNHFTRIIGLTDKINTITHKELDKQNNEFFNQGFAETLPQEGYRRLYFDVEINEYISDEWLEDIINSLNDLAVTLNTTFAACGYTNNKNIIKQYINSSNIRKHLMLEYKKDSEIKHVVSFHAYFKKVFEVKDIFKVFSEYKDYLLLEKGVDFSVYKSEKKEQLFRHPFARKVNNSFKAINTEIDFTAFENSFKASDLIATPDGTEPKGTYQELYNAVVDDIEVKMKAKKTEQTKTKTEDEDEEEEEDEDEDDTVKCCEVLLKAVCDEGFKRKQTMHDVVAFLPRSKDEDINRSFVEAYKRLYNKAKHNTPENIEELHMKLKHCNGFLTCMSNIKNKYFEKHGYEHIMQLVNTKAAKLKLTEKDQAELDGYETFIARHRSLVNTYFRFYDYIHTTANEKKFLQRCLSSNKCHTKFYTQNYVRKMLYIANEKYLYRKTLYETQPKSLDSSSFKIYLKRVFKGIGDIGEKFNSKLKIFHNEDLLESRDGLVYPRYRDLDYNEVLTNDEFKTFETAYKATFKDQCCADFAFKILIQDIASGFHDNSSIIKFYYGTGGNNKDCETCIYENIINNNDLVFKTSNFEVLADEKNKNVVSSIYVQFNEMPANNKDRFDVFINALKNYNECGKQTTRGLFENFTTINTNIRFQCNTNHPMLRDWLLDNANDAIKRRFFVAERVHSDRWSDWLYNFTHDEDRCKALKMYIKNNADELYTEKLNSMSVLQFYKDHEELYAKYTEAKANDEFEELKEALCCSGCVRGKRTKDGEDMFVVNVREWYTHFIDGNKKKCSESTFRSKVNQYISYEKNCYIDNDRASGKYFITNDELIQALNENEHIVIV